MFLHFQVIGDFKPHVIFSAHSHLSRLRGPSIMTPSPLDGIFGPIQLGLMNQTKNSDYDSSWSNSAEVHEIEVPTCSYRMGVSDMGYGYALFGE